MEKTEHQRFFDAEMPKWYRIAALAVRVVGALIAWPCAWLMARESVESSMLPTVGMLAGFFLMVIPSLPKAYIEQRNRIRGLRDGSFQKYSEDKEKTKSQPEDGG